MTKASNLHRLNPKGGAAPTVQETMNALIQEAHRQQKRAGDPAQARTTRTATERKATGSFSMLPDKLHSLLRETVPARRLTDLILEEETIVEVRELISEVRQTALLSDPAWSRRTISGTLIFGQHPMLVNNKAGDRWSPG